MERQERKVLQSIRKQLERDLKRIDRLLKTAGPSRVMNDQQVAERIAAIIARIKRARGRVTKTALGEIAASVGMAPTSVGSLYNTGYVKSDPSDKRYVILGDRRPKQVRKRKRAR